MHGTTLITNAVDRAAGRRHGLPRHQGISRRPRYRQGAAIRSIRLAHSFSRSAGAEASSTRDRRAHPVRRNRRDARWTKREIRRAMADLVEQHEIEALAVGLLHSYANPAHERQIQALVTQEFPSSAAVDLFGRLPIHARVRALDHDDSQRLHAAHGGSLPGALESGIESSDFRRQVLRHDFERGRSDAGYGAPVSRAPDRIWTCGGRADVAATSASISPGARMCSPSTWGGPPPKAA